MRVTPEESTGGVSDNKVAVGTRLFWATFVMRKTSGSGNQMIVVKYLCVKDELTEGKEIGKEIWENFVLTPNAAWKLRNACFALQSNGFDSDDHDETERVLTSRPMYITVREDEYTNSLGKTVSKNVCQTFTRYNGQVTEELEQVIIDAEKQFQGKSSNTGTGFSRTDVVPF